MFADGAHRTRIAVELVALISPEDVFPAVG